MEVPTELKTIYSHWPKHTERISSKGREVFIKQTIYSDMIQFSNERMEIYRKKSLKMNAPFTSDPILQRFRFCNIYRELDRQTIFFHKLLKPYTEDLNLWLLNMLFCRFICNTDTIEKIGLLSFNNENNKNVFERLIDLNSPKYGTAYIFPISIIQRSEWNTREKFFSFYLPTVIKEIAVEIKTFNNTSVVEALNRILPVFKFNFKFHWTEVLIDLAYQYPQFIDLFKQFPIGPGSLPTMKSLNSNIPPEQVCLQLVSRLPDEFNYLTFDNSPVHLSAENWEGIGCEFRKYKNLQNGDGRIRLYK